jgi:ribosome-associated protein
LNNLKVLNERKKSLTRLTRNSKLFKTIIHAIEEKKGEQIVSLDLRKIPEAVSDFFIICQASNNNQLKAIADNIEKEVALLDKVIKAIVSAEIGAVTNEMNYSFEVGV